MTDPTLAPMLRGLKRWYDSHDSIDHENKLNEIYPELLALQRADYKGLQAAEKIKLLKAAVVLLESGDVERAANPSEWGFL